MRELIQQNPYISLLIATTVEGPIATFISAGLAQHGILRLEYVVIITVLGDIIGDIGLYMIGRYAHKVGLITRLIQKIPQTRKQTFHNNALVTIIIGKCTPYLATPTLIFAGLQHMNVVRFVGYSCIISVLVKAIYITLGYIGAVSAQQITQFLHGRQTIAGYIIVGGLSLWLCTWIYSSIASRIRDRMTEKL